MLFVDKRLNYANFFSLVLLDFPGVPRRNRRFLMQKLIDAMEDDDDVQNVWHNWEE